MQSSNCEQTNCRGCCRGTRVDVGSSTWGPNGEFGGEQMRDCDSRLHGLRWPFATICIERFVGARDKEPGRRKCFGCGHSTRKFVCGKCGVNLPMHSGRTSGGESNVPTTSDHHTGRVIRTHFPKRSCGHRRSKPTCAKCGADTRQEHQCGYVH